ncbi:hypothetical protein CBL_20290 [Carabus blaptoides fortunei]
MKFSSLQTSWVMTSLYIDCIIVKPEISLQVTRLAKFFMAVGGSEVEKYRGKTLDEIEIADPALRDGVCNSDSEISDVDTQSTSTSVQSERKFYLKSSERTQNKRFKGSAATEQIL